MRTRRYLDDVLGSKAKVNVLRALFSHPQMPTTPLQIAASAKASSRTPVLRAVRQLEATGVLTLASHGHAYLVKLNPRNAAYPVLEALFREEGGSWDAFLAGLKALVPRRATSCALFGSVLEGKEGPGSDIDLLLIVPDLSAKDEAQAGLPTFMEAYGMPLSWYVLTEREFERQKGTPVLLSIRRRHALIKGEDSWRK